MNLKQIVEILELDKLAPIHYHNGTVKNIFESKLYDKARLPDLSPDETFGVYFPDTDIYEACSMLCDFNKALFPAITEKVHLQYNDENMTMIFTLFCMYHEIGHWIDYNNRTEQGKLLWLHERRNNTLELTDIRRFRRIKLPQMSNDWHEFEDMCDYYDQTHEKAANDFARTHYLDAYDKIIKCERK